jgi:hypothetical protein
VAKPQRSGNAAPFVSVTRGAEAFERARQASRRVASGATRAWGDSAEIWNAAAVGGYSPSGFIADVVSFWINATAMLLGCEPLPPDHGPLAFDHVAEVVGPVEISVPSGYHFAKVTELRLAGPPSRTIPATHVRVRQVNHRHVVTLVNLFALQSRLLPGEYFGRIEFHHGRSTTTVPLRATRF